MKMGLTANNLKYALTSLFLAVIIHNGVVVHAENIDPNEDGSQYAWGENVGWMNLEPDCDGAPGVDVSDDRLTGYIWSENFGWISLSCENSNSCDRTDYGIGNDGTGILSGYAWGENVGWINFAPSNAGVAIDPATGEFSGRAWGENIGWLTFKSETPGLYRAKTSWPSCNGLETFAKAFGAVDGDLNYSASCDDNGDGDVDGADLQEFRNTLIVNSK